MARAMISAQCTKSALRRFFARLEHGQVGRALGKLDQALPAPHPDRLEVLRLFGSVERLGSLLPATSRREQPFPIGSLCASFLPGTSHHARHQADLK